MTLLESLIVVSIIVLIVSMLYPVLQKAKWQFKITRSMSQMSQIHRALSIYVANYDADGSAYLGLPPSGVALFREMRLPTSLYHTGGVPWSNPHAPALYTWMPPPSDPRQASLIPLWNSHVEATSRNPIVLVDDTFNHDGSQFIAKLGIGLFLDGHIEKRRRRGSLKVYDAWQ